MRRILTIGKLSKKFLLGLLTAVLLICPATAIETIHTEQTGSLTIKSSYDGQPLTNVPFAVYRVADVSQYGSFTLLPQYTGSKAAVNQLTQDAAIRLAQGSAAAAAHGRRTMPSPQMRKKIPIKTAQ